MLSRAALSGTGTVLRVYPGERKLHIDHAPIEALGWPAMAMDFSLSDNVDVTDIAVGTTVRFTLVKDASGSYRIDSLQRQE